MAEAFCKPPIQSSRDSSSFTQVIAPFRLFFTIFHILMIGFFHSALQIQFDEKDKGERELELGEGA